VKQEKESKNRKRWFRGGRERWYGGEEGKGKWRKRERDTMKWKEKERSEEEKGRGGEERGIEE